MTAYRIVAVQRSELATVGVTCEDCGTVVSINLDKARHAEHGKTPTYCPSCERPFSEDAKAALAALTTFHRRARLAESGPDKLIFRFEIRQPE